MNLARIDRVDAIPTLPSSSSECTNPREMGVTLGVTPCVGVTECQSPPSEKNAMPPIMRLTPQCSGRALAYMTSHFIYHGPLQLLVRRLAQRSSTPLDVATSARLLRTRTPLDASRHQRTRAMCLSPASSRLRSGTERPFAPRCFANRYIPCRAKNTDIRADMHTAFGSAMPMIDATERHDWHRSDDCWDAVRVLRAVHVAA